jgi:hypothetical protein
MFSFIAGFLVGIIVICAVIYLAIRKPPNFLRW